MKPRPLVGLILASFAVLALAIGEARAAGQRVALVIGNGAYTAINRLANPANDANDMAQALRKVGFEVIVRINADKGNFERALAEFARKSAGASAALFYYAGHGVQSQKRNYLLPVDIEVQDETDLEFQALSVPHVMEAFDRVPGVKIMMLDACRDNPLDRRITSSSRSVGSRGLARIDASEGLVIAYATSPDQIAQDGSERNSPFTEAFIRRLAEPDLEIATLFRRVTQDVYERTNGRQRPEVSISLIGDFYLNPMSADALAWSRIANSIDAGDFERFIQRYPQSAHVPDARRKLEVFARIQQERDQRLLRENEQQASAREQMQQEQARAREQMQQEQAERERKRIDALRQAREEVERKTLQGQAERRESDRVAVERLIAARQARTQSAAVQPDARPNVQPGAADILADRREVERLAEKRRQEAEEAQIAAERHQLRQLILRRQKATGAEAERLDAEIRDLVRKQVERLAGQKRQQLNCPPEASQTAGGLSSKATGGRAEPKTD